jgi:hypothetical protein
MPATSPKNSRDKRLHLVFFTDASKTKSTSISIRNLVILVVAVFGVFTASGFSLYLYRSNRNHLSQKDEYIRELKSSIAAFAVTNEKNQILMASDGDPQTDLTKRVAREIQNPTASDKKPQLVAGGDNTLANLQSSLSSLSTVSANLARNEKPAAQPQIDFSKQNSASKPTAAAPTTEKVMAARDVASIPAQDATPSVPLTGVQVEQRHTTEFNGQTTLHFQLVNTAKGKGQSWMGRVCGVAELTREVQGKSAGQPGMIAIPSGQPVQTAQNPSNSCADGELVRFSRLRPTELVVPARQDVIKRVTIFFVESGSNRTLTQRIDL